MDIDMDDNERNDFLDAKAAWNLIQKETRKTSLQVIFFYASWNNLVTQETPSSQQRIELLISRLHQMLQHDSMQKNPILSISNVPISAVRVDTSEESMDICIHKDYFQCPSSLPSIALITPNLGNIQITHCNIEPPLLLSLSQLSPIYQKSLQPIQTILTQTLLKLSPKKQTRTFSQKRPMKESQTCLRIFISGDRSKVGKSSVCMGILGNLLKTYKASELGYIKPATQCEETQLITKFCQYHDIEAIPVGPVVYYKGFTRAFLDGKTASTNELLRSITEAVDKLSTTKKVVIVDGVGYPSVGSICGTCNASVATASGYPTREGKRIPAPVILVGKSGVGDAIDSYNMNASYFQYQNVTVLGAIFNRLSTSGYYSLENCKGAVTQYFETYKQHEQVFGFVPELPSIAQARSTSDEGLQNLLESANEFVSVFGQYVDMALIMKAAETHQKQEVLEQIFKKPKILSVKPNPALSLLPRLSRNAIENAASKSGASAA